MFTKFQDAFFSQNFWINITQNYTEKYSIFIEINNWLDGNRTTTNGYFSSWMRCFVEVAIGPFSATLGSVGSSNTRLFFWRLLSRNAFHAILRVPEGGPGAISNTPWSPLNAIKRNWLSGHFETFYLHSEHLIMLKHWFNHHIKFLSNKSWFDALILTILNAFNQISVNDKNSCTRSVPRSAHKNFRKSLNSLAISNINANIILFIVL